jgi:hypothetical protein
LSFELDDAKRQIFTFHISVSFRSTIVRELNSRVMELGLFMCSRRVRLLKRYSNIVFFFMRKKESSKNEKNVSLVTAEQNSLP